MRRIAVPRHLSLGRLASLAAVAAAVGSCGGGEFRAQGSGGADAGPLPDAADAQPADAPASGEAGPPIPSGLPLNAGQVLLAAGTTAGDLEVRIGAAAGPWLAPARIGPADKAVFVVPIVDKRGSAFVGATNDDGTLRVYDGEPDGWRNGFSARTPSGARRAFDLEIEDATGDALAVYSVGQPMPKYRVRRAGKWSPEQDVGYAAGANVAWVELVRRPRTNEIALLVADTARTLYAALWNGASFTSGALVAQGLTRDDFACFAGAYEGVSGDLVVVYGNATTTSFDVRRATTGAWQGAQVLVNDTPAAVVTLSSDPATDRVALAHLEYHPSCSGGGGCDNFEAAMWTGAAWEGNAATELDPDVTTRYGTRPGTRPAAVSFIGTGAAVALYHRSTAGFRWSRYNGTAWGTVATQATTPALPDKASFAVATLAASALVAIADVNGGVWAKLYDGQWRDTEGGAPLATIDASRGVAFGVATRPP